MSTAASSTRVAAPVVRAGWRASVLGAGLGIAAGGLASAFLIGAVIVGTQVAGAGPVEDGIFDALAPLSFFALVPIVAALWLDATVRREVFWRITGHCPTWGASLGAALVAPSAVIGLRDRGGSIVWVLVAGTFILRRWSEPTVRAPRRPTTRSAAAIGVGAALCVGVGGLAASQLARPALGVEATLSPGPPRVTVDARHAEFPVRLASRVFTDVTVLGLQGPSGRDVRLQSEQPGEPVLLVVPGSGALAARVVLDVPSCPGEVSASALEVRYRILGVERASLVQLPRELRARC